MNDYRDVLASKLAILRGKKITFEHLDSHTRGTTLDHGFDLSQFTGMSDKADKIAKAAVHQTLNDTRSDEARSSRYKNSVFRPDDERILICL